MTSARSDIEPLDDLSEPLFRQIHPTFLRDGQPTSQAWRPR